MNWPSHGILRYQPRPAGASGNLEEEKMVTIGRWTLALCTLHALCLWGCAGIPEQASPSAQLYMKRCSFCHRLPHPGRHGSATWEEMITVLDKGVMPVFSEEEKKQSLSICVPARKRSYTPCAAASVTPCRIEKDCPPMNGGIKSWCWATMRCPSTPMKRGS